MRPRSSSPPRCRTHPRTAPRSILSAVEAADAAGHTLRGLKLARRALAELPDDAEPVRRATLLLAVVVAALGNEIDGEALALTSEALHLVPEQPPTAFRPGCWPCTPGSR